MRTIGLEWTVLTWNIEGTKRTDLDRIAATISAQCPDIVVIQEIRRPQAASLAVLLSMAHVWDEKHNPWRPLFASRAEGLAILTPHDLSDTWSALVSTTQRKRSFRRRIVQWGTVQRSDASGYRVYNAHLSPHDLHPERIAEARSISTIAASHGASPPTIVAGDLNDFGGPEVIAELPGIEVLAAPATNPSDRPTQHLDHVLVPVDATHVSVGAPGGGPEWAELSDHLPLTVRFTLDWVQGGFGG